MRQHIFALGFITAAGIAFAQEAIETDHAGPPVNPAATAGSAWLDLRQNAKPGSVQVAPGWVESVTFIPAPEKAAAESRSVFRIRLNKPAGVSRVLFFRLFFNDKAAAHPEVVAWDESGSQLLRSGPIGTGIELETSQSVMVPMHGATSIDVEVPGDGSTVRGAYLEWMASSELVHAASAGSQDSVPEPFAATSALRAPPQDSEVFGTVTAALSAEPVRIGPTPEEGATFEFGIESQPLLALLTFEIANPSIDSPPELTVNGQAAGAVTLTLPELADPGYRGEMHPLVNRMQFQYTGWIRAQKIVPANLLQNGANNVVIVNGPNAAASVIRATQIQLKYLWDKSDYILKPGR